MSEEQKDGGSLLGTVLGLGMVATGAWWVNSRFFIDHNVYLPPALPAPHERFQSPTTGVLNYYVDESGSGAPLVLVHSINAAASAYEMKPLFEHYRGSRPIYALDLPGYGFSSREDRRYTPDLFAAAILEFLENVVQEPADVIALSLGAEFAARAAMQQPERFRSLAFISPTGFNPQDVDFPEETLHSIYTVPLWSQALFDLLVTRAFMQYFVAKLFVGDIPDGYVDYAYATAHQPGAKHAPLYFISGQLFTVGVRASIYSKLTMPVLVLYDRDANVSFEALPGFVEKHDNWQAKRIVPTGSLPHWEKPHECSQALDEFWAASES